MIQVLLIEDEESIRRVMSRILKEENDQYHEYYNIDEWDDDERSPSGFMYVVPSNRGKGIIGDIIERLGKLSL